MASITRPPGSRSVRSASSARGALIGAGVGEELPGASPTEHGHASQAQAPAQHAAGGSDGVVGTVHSAGAINPCRRIKIVRRRGPIGLEFSAFDGPPAVYVRATFTDLINSVSYQLNLGAP